jgi:transcriptional regulator with XRE-family HTH domain
MGGIGLEIGKGLRRARRARGFTLRDVSRLSEGKYKPTSVAGYERGERAISLERFCDLCRLYGVPPPALLAEILGLVLATPEPDIDAQLLESLGEAEAAFVSGFVREIRALRRGRPSDTIALRAGDVEVLATAAGTKADELIHILDPSTGAGSGPDDVGNAPPP